MMNLLDQIIDNAANVISEQHNPDQIKIELPSPESEIARLHSLITDASERAARTVKVQGSKSKVQG